MRIETFNTIYVMETPCELMDKIRSNSNYWADGDENICLTFEEAIEIEELKPLLDNIKNAGDVIISC